MSRTTRATRVVFCAACCVSLIIGACGSDTPAAAPAAGSGGGPALVVENPGSGGRPAAISGGSGAGSSAPHATAGAAAAGSGGSIASAGAAAAGTGGSSAANSGGAPSAGAGGAGGAGGDTGGAGDDDILGALFPAPQVSCDDVVSPVALALEQERRVSEQINTLAATARAEDDYTSEQFMLWFIKEQIEEVATMSDLLRVVERSRDDPMDVENWLAREHSGAEAVDPTAPRPAGAGA